jgi:hypothetical protein
MSNRRRTTDCSFERARHRAPMPEARIREQPMAYDPASGQLVAPWPRGTITENDEQALVAVLDQIAAFPLRVPVWLWPTGDRAPVPIEADNPRLWFSRWSENRAVYRDRRWLGPGRPLAPDVRQQRAAPSRSRA